MTFARSLAASLILLLLALVAWRDVTTRIIPDWMCAALAASGLLVRALQGLEALAVSAGMAALVLVAFLPIHARGMLGGGDVKLFAALTLGLSAAGAWRLMVATALAGGVLVLLHLAMRRLPPASHCTKQSSFLFRIYNIERWRVRRRGSLPYGVAIACGGGWTVLSGWGA
jgi:prepilin peptidase CpaA